MGRILLHEAEFYLFETAQLLLRLFSTTLTAPKWQFLDWPPADSTPQEPLRLPSNTIHTLSHLHTGLLDAAASCDITTPFPPSKHLLPSHSLLLALRKSDPENTVSSLPLLSLIRSPRPPVQDLQHTSPRQCPPAAESFRPRQTALLPCPNSPHSTPLRH